jgi:hypothetical protein
MLEVWMVQCKMFSFLRSSLFHQNYTFTTISLEEDCIISRSKQFRSHALIKVKYRQWRCLHNPNSICTSKILANFLRKNKKNCGLQVKTFNHSANIWIQSVKVCNGLCTWSAASCSRQSWDWNCSCSFLRCSYFCSCNFCSWDSAANLLAGCTADSMCVHNSCIQSAIEIQGWMLIQDQFEI